MPGPGSGVVITSISFSEVIERMDDAAGDGTGVRVFPSRWRTRPSEGAIANTVSLTWALIWVRSGPLLGKIC